MKTYAAIILGVALATSGAVAQNVNEAGEQSYFSCVANCNSATLERAKKAYNRSLASDNDGVVESAIAQIAYMRAAAPKEDMNRIEETLNNLSLNGRTQSIRYKAYLASQVFASPQMFTAEASRYYSNGDEFFTALSSRLQRTLLGDNRNAE